MSSTHNPHHRQPAGTQRRPSSRRHVVAALSAAGMAAVSLSALAAPAHADASTTGRDKRGPVVVASGLDNPRLLSFGPNGSLYVAESGRGGTLGCVDGPEGRACLGLTGAITEIRKGSQKRVITGLPSTANAMGSATGPNDVAVTGRHVYVLIGLGNDPAVRAKMPAAAKTMGTLVSAQVPRGRHSVVAHRGGMRVVADLAAYEAAKNPDKGDPAKGGVDTNPTGLEVNRSGAVIADAGANDVLGVDLNRRHSRIRTLAVLPARGPMQSVPTSVVTGPDGALYVSELTGFPFPKGGSVIWRVEKGKAPTQYASGLTNVTDLAWHKESLYAVQLADAGLLGTPPGQLPSGSLVKVHAGATNPSQHATVAGALRAPYGVAFDGRSAYVSTCAMCTGAGQVVRIPLR